MYNFELINIDPHQCSIEELENEIERLRLIKEEYSTREGSIKVFLNSCYGALASPWFEGFNIDIAEAITLQSQNLSKFASKIIDEYFLNIWHTDNELHKKLDVTYVNKLLDKTLTIYMDTDSCYFTFDSVYKSCDSKLSPVDFMLKIKEHGFDKFIENKFNEYAKSFNTKNLQNLELEKICYSALMIAKKKYVLDFAWKDPGVYFKPQEKIKFVGVEIQQGSTPKFVRKVHKELIKMELREKNALKFADVVKELKRYKKEFCMQDPEDISKQMRINDYEKYVLEDKNEIVLEKKAQVNVQSSAIYNHTLMKSKYRSKYNLIRTGDKIKFYYAKGDHQVFAFLPGNFPMEFAPEIDYDVQFAKMIIEPLNRFLEPLGFVEIPHNLLYSTSLF
jgi:DNA polymerase elongation subunit (family B)